MEPVIGERIIVLIDMDCFYVQVEQKLNPAYEGKPCAVVQYNTWKGGGIIAVNYEARACGVKRGMRGDEAKRLCPDIHNFAVPEIRGKGDLTRYREAGASVMDVLCEFCDCVERASVDEAFLDITSLVATKMKQNCNHVLVDHLPNTFVVGWEQSDTGGGDLNSWLENIYENDECLLEQRLAFAAVMVEEMRAEVFNKTMFRCSAGIANNKMLAKLACGLHKPNKQTILPRASVPLLFQSLPIQKVRNLGGKLGEEVKEKLNVNMMGDLRNYTQAQLQSSFGEKTGSWLHNISRGIDYEAVVSRQLPKSIGCGKNFPGKNALDTKQKVTHWLQQLITELTERLQKDQIDNQRFARSLTINLRCKDDHHNYIVISRTCAIRVYNAAKMTNDALQVLQKLNTASSSLLWKPPILSLAMSAGKFEDSVDASTCNIENYFASAKSSSGASGQKTPQKKDSISKNTENDKSEAFSKNCDNEIGSKQCKDGVGKVTVIPPKKGSIEGFFGKKVSICTNVAPSEENSLDSTCVSFAKEELNIVYTDEDSLLSESSIISNESCISKTLSSVESCDDITSDADDINRASTSTGFFARKLAEWKKRHPKHHPDFHESDCSSISSAVSQDSIIVEDLQNIPVTKKEKATTSLVHNNKKSLFQNWCASQSNKPDDSKVHNTVEGEKKNLPVELQTLCVKCNQHIPVWKIDEHADYHVALKIQKEVNCNSVKRAPTTTNTKKLKTGGKKRSSKIKTNTSNTKKIKQNTLDSFIK